MTADALAASKHIVSSLRHHAALGHHLTLTRLVIAVQQQQQPPPPPSDSTLLLLPPDPTLSHELALPEVGTPAAVRLAVAVHAHACEAYAALGRWDEVVRHARIGLESVRNLPRGARARLVQWRELYFGHAALLGSVRCGTATAESLAASRLSLLRQLRDFCRHRATAMGSASAAALTSSSDQPPAVALLRLAVGLAGSISTSSSSTRTLHDPTEALQTLLAALRCALAESGAEADTAMSSPPPAALGASPPPAALGGSRSPPTRFSVTDEIVREIVRALAELGRTAEQWEASGASGHGHGATRVEDESQRRWMHATGACNRSQSHGTTRVQDESHDHVDVDEDVREDVDEVLLLAPEPGTVVTETVFPPPAKRARTVAGLPSVAPSWAPHPPLAKRPKRRDGLDSWQPTLWICGGTAALLVLAGGGASAGIDTLCRALCLSGACLPGSVTDAAQARVDDAVLVPVALTVDVPAAPGVPRVDERMKALAWAEYVHAHCIGRVALHRHSTAAAAAAAAASSSSVFR